jgi:hypothetical protein
MVPVRGHPANRIRSRWRPVAPVAAGEPRRKIVMIREARLLAVARVFALTAAMCLWEYTQCRQMD